MMRLLKLLAKRLSSLRFKRRRPEPTIEEIADKAVEKYGEALRNLAKGE